MKAASISFIVLCVFFAFCKETRQNDVKPKFKNILILGNSITHHLPSPGIGWNGDWGMAASSRDSDFVHILSRRFTQESKVSKVNFRNIADFETGYWNYDFTKLDSLRDLNPDLVILRIGENVKDSDLDVHDFEIYYLKLINHFKVKNPKIKVLCVSSFWNQPRTTQYITTVSVNNQFPFLELHKLSEDITNTAVGQFTNPGVASHPSDKGMNAIADLIWTEVQKLEKL